MADKLAVVLFNLGGPDGPDAVRPFLQNLFSDKAIITAPAPVRFLVSRLVSRLRAPSVKKNYAMMDAGGGSPLLPETKAQARALEDALADAFPDKESRAFIAMRYWHPFTEEAVREVEAWGADEVVLLPLYPQFSTTTTGSSLDAWTEAGGRSAHTVCCYPFEDAFLHAHRDRILEAWTAAGKPENPLVLMSAHGLPERTVAGGDPYQWQCEAMAERLAALLPDHFESRTCYQSRVGPLKWIGPDTEEEIEAAAEAGRHILVAPIAFVSDHIETLVELGEEYREVAEAHGAASYTAVRALGTHEGFITHLADLVGEALGRAAGTVAPCGGKRLCPGVHGRCPATEGAAPDAAAIAAPAETGAL